MPDEKTQIEELSAGWDAQTELGEILDPTEGEKPAEEKSETREGYSDDLEKTWNEIEAKRDPVKSEPSEFDVAAHFAPYRQMLEAGGTTAERYAAGLEAIGEVMTSIPENTDLFKGMSKAQRLNRIIEIGASMSPEDQRQLGQAAAQREYLNQGAREWQDYLKFRPDAAALRVRMGEHLYAAPQRQGESFKDAFERAYQAELAKGPSSREDAATSAWAEVGGTR